MLDQPLLLKRAVHQLLSLSPGLLQSGSSSQVVLRHPDNTIYRCFLPDLTGFIVICRARPDLQHLQTKAVSAEQTLELGFNPARADLGYRAPLVPHLARPKQYYYVAPISFKVTIHHLNVRLKYLVNQLSPFFAA